LHNLFFLAQAQYKACAPTKFTTERNGRKTLTTVQGLPKKFDQKKILKVIKKKFACNGTIVTDVEMGEVVQLQGDQRKDVQDFLTDKKEGLGLDVKTIKVSCNCGLELNKSDTTDAHYRFTVSRPLRPQNVLPQMFASTSFAARLLSQSPKNNHGLVYHANEEEAGLDRQGGGACEYLAWPRTQPQACERARKDRNSC
jgi:translation initiation factor SUI1